MDVISLFCGYFQFMPYSLVMGFVLLWIINLIRSITLSFPITDWPILPLMFHFLASKFTLYCYVLSLLCIWLIGVLWMTYLFFWLCTCKITSKKKKKFVTLTLLSILSWIKLPVCYTSSYISSFSLHFLWYHIFKLILVVGGLHTC